MKKVALCLASGGARGLAHIGAIEELEARGYQITSISGCSMGSLIGGIYAAGKIHEARQWFCDLDTRDILSLTDFSFGLSHMVKGDRVMQAIQEFVPNCRIEDLPIPAAFVATDMVNSQPVVFRSGLLFDAIRASISIPLCFEPVRHEGTLLVDGGLVNPFPLDLVERQEGDILVGINISGRSRMADALMRLPKLEQTTLEHLGRFREKAEEAWGRLARSIDETIAPNVNYLSLINRTIDLQIQANCRNMAQFYQPDVLVEMAQDAYTTFDFDKAEEIINRGRELMAEKLNIYEKTLS